MKVHPRELVDPTPDEVGCAGKVAFDTFDLANKVNRIRNARRDLARQPYRCRCCHKWHLGTAKRK